MLLCYSQGIEALQCMAVRVSAPGVQPCYVAVQPACGPTSQQQQRNRQKKCCARYAGREQTHMDDHSQTAQVSHQVQNHDVPYFGSAVAESLLPCCLCLADVTQKHTRVAHRDIGCVHVHVSAECAATRLIKQWNHRHRWEQLPCKACSFLYMSCWYSFWQNPIYAGCLCVKLEMIWTCFQE